MSEMIEIPTSQGEPASATTLSINHEAMIGLDSSNAFEGPEKLLEVWFCSDAESLPPSAQPDGLKAVSQKTWEVMLDIVNCKVLSCVENDHVDAYLLSESSMFVFPHKLILKTCGTTTLLRGIPEMLRIAAEEAGFSQKRGDVPISKQWRVFYSRKAFMFPEKQMHPHRSWEDEVETLNELFGKGRAYMVGRTDGDHWYLYMSSPGALPAPPLTPPEELLVEDQLLTEIPTFPVLENGEVVFGNHGLGCEGSGNGIFDETLEVLMTDLCPIKAKQFYLENASAVAAEQHRQRQKIASAVDDDDKGSIDSGFEDLPEHLTSEGHGLGTVVTESCGLGEIYPRSTFPEARIDSYVFSPCGYSANAVIPSPDLSNNTTHYFTVHVTPEPHCSYASFETNVPGCRPGVDTAEVVQKVVDIFRPGRFSVTLFEAKAQPGSPDFHKVAVQAYLRAANMDNVKGYRTFDKIVYDLDGYNLVFRHFVRID